MGEGQRAEGGMERNTKRVKSRCPERRAGVERGAWGKIPEKKKLQGGDMEQVIKKERRGRGRRHGEKYQRDRQRKNGHTWIQRA